MIQMGLSMWLFLLYIKNIMASLQLSIHAVVLFHSQTKALHLQAHVNAWTRV